MAVTPEIDGIASQIVSLEQLVQALDGIQPIQIAIGTHGLVVDPAVMPEAYGRGLDVIRSVSQSAIIDLRNAISDTIVAQSRPIGPTGASGATGPVGGETGATDEATGATGATGAMG